MENVWSLVLRYQGRHPVSDAALARKAGMHEATLNSWKKGRLGKMPKPEELYRLAVAIDARYQEVLDAALLDWGYQPEEVARDAAANRPAADVLHLDARRRTQTSKAARQHSKDNPKGPTPQD